MKPIVKGRWLILVCGWLSLPVSHSWAAIPKEMPANPDVTVVFRYDDYSAKTDFAAFEMQMFGLFIEHQIPLTVGVIPSISAGDAHESSPQSLLRMTQGRIQPLKQMLVSGQCEIAQHGFSHQTNRRGRFYTEFMGLPFPAQVERIGQGRVQLEADFDTSITTFIPPWNRFDENTLRALDLAGFKTLSAGAQFSAAHAVKLKLVPLTCQLREARKAIDEARQGGGKTVVVVLFHAYDFSEISCDKGRMALSDLATLLLELKASQSIKFRTLSQVADEFPCLGGEYMERFSSIQQLGVQQLLPRSLRTYLLFLPPPEFLPRMRLNLAARIFSRLVFCYSCALAVGMVGCCVLRRLKRWGSKIWVAVMIGFAIMIVCLLYDVRSEGLDRLYRLALLLTAFVAMLWCRRVGETRVP